MELGATLLEVGTFFGYFSVLILIAVLSYRKQKSDKDFLIGNRSLNFWLTALSAHASDMSSWLFLAYPASIFTGGLISAWAAIGLTVGMYLNWQFIAPKIRTVTEQMGNLTMSGYFESRFSDTSGSIRLVSAAMSVLFFTFYISSGLVGMGILVENLFQLNYTVGISIGLIIVMLYVFMGGYRTVAWIDLFQGFFLLGVIVIIPTYLISSYGGMSPIMHAVKLKNLSSSIFPEMNALSIWTVLMTAAGWGLGYFGQPHIITKFMGIRKVDEIYKAKYLGISWQIIALSAATLVGLLGVYVFPQGLEHNEQVILDIVKTTLPPVFAGLVLCAILAATTNVMAAQVLVVASNLSEDFYKRIFRRHASSKELLWISRAGVVFVCSIGFAIAFFKISTIFELVQYSWSGLGASFGPLLILSLYRKSLNKYGAFAGILVGGLTAAIWPYFENKFGFPIPSLVLGFVLSTLAIEGISYIMRKRLALAVEP
ncbi:MAG: sodium/proline symporter [Parachlamydiales bacterium]|nr:sodium/proline symporter [Parachlamydiales bacterium]